jgi:5'-3' exonuclease
LKKLLISIGFPVLQSVEETDFLIAALSKEGLISAAFSTDTDLCIYGVDYLLTNYYQNQFTILDRRVLLEETGLDQDQLVDLAILLSCDYNSRIPGVGKKTAFDLIEKFETLEMIPAKYRQKSLRRTMIRDRFKNIPSWATLVDYRSSSISEPDIDLLVFSKKHFLKNAFKALQKYDLINRWEDTLELVKEKL